MSEECKSALTLFGWLLKVYEKEKKNLGDVLYWVLRRFCYALVISPIHLIIEFLSVCR